MLHLVGFAWIQLDVLETFNLSHGTSEVGGLWLRVAVFDGPNCVVVSQFVHLRTETDSAVKCRMMDSG